MTRQQPDGYDFLEEAPLSHRIIAAFLFGSVVGVLLPLVAGFRALIATSRVFPELAGHALGELLRSAGYGLVLLVSYVLVFAIAGAGLGAATSLSIMRRSRPLAAFTAGVLIYTLIGYLLILFDQPQMSPFAPFIIGLFGGTVWAIAVAVRWVRWPF